MDISHASYKGIPICWISPAGEVSPWSYEPEGLGWLRTFAGGLLTTCGLTHIHFPEVVGDKSYGLHGRASTLVASNVHAGAEWDGDEYRLWVSGRTMESALFDEQMELQRDDFDGVGIGQSADRRRGHERRIPGNAARDALSHQHGVPGVGSRCQAGCAELARRTGRYQSA